jgi:glycosyltransferase involved in cell wall biosynthesis
MEVVVAYLREQVKGSRSLRADFERQGVPVIDLRAQHRYDLHFMATLPRLLKAEQPAIIHTHSPRADLAGSLGHFLWPSVPWVCSIHDIYSKTWAGSWTLMLFNRVWRRANAVVAISHAVMDWLVTERRVRPDRVKVIHYGIEPERFVQSTSHIQKVWALNRHAVVGSIGRLEHRKGHDCLIAGMTYVLERVPTAALLIAGHDPWGYGKNLQALINGLGLTEQVRLVGFQDDVAAFLSALDVFVFASRTEGFGQVVIEAMAAGKPVVASRIPPLTEIVVDGETGILVEPEAPKAFADAIVWLLTHTAEAQEMGRRGQERVHSHFSAERMSTQTLSLYYTLLGARDV